MMLVDQDVSPISADAPSGASGLHSGGAPPVGRVKDVEAHTDRLMSSRLVRSWKVADLKRFFPTLAWPGRTFRATPPFGIPGARSASCRA